MTADEFAAWIEFYRAYPFDDFHRYHRPAALVSQSIRGGELRPLLDWLQPEPVPDGMTLADMNTLRALGVRR